MEWRTDMENAPDDAHHLRGMWVYCAQSGRPLYWTADAGYVDSDGDFCFTGGDVTGWKADDYTHWMPLPPPPGPPIEHVRDRDA